MGKFANEFVDGGGQFYRWLIFSSSSDKLYLIYCRDSFAYIQFCFYQDAMGLANFFLKKEAIFFDVKLNLIRWYNMIWKLDTYFTRVWFNYD